METIQTPEGFIFVILIKEIAGKCKWLGWFILLNIWIDYSALGSDCYRADDIGLGNGYVLSANPADDSLVLLRNTPLNNQVAPWVDTGLIVDANATTLTMQISGSWNPWVDNLSTNPTCSMASCDPSEEGVSCVASPSGLKVVSQVNGVFTACNLDADESDGSYGLYGLIAIADSTNNYVAQDPNDSSYWDFLPPDSFRTFRVAPFTTDAVGSKFFTLSNTSVCDLPLANAGSNVTCTSDTGIKAGKLYMKVVDTYYEDNSGSYIVHFASGIKTKKGFIQSTIEAFEASLTHYGEIIYESIRGDVSYISMVKALAVLYIAICGALLAIGMLNIHVSEFVKILFKLGIIFTMLSDTSLVFFQTYVFEFIIQGFDSFALMILNAAMQQFTVPFSVSIEQSPLAIYDVILKMVTSEVVNLKIVSVIFYKYWLFLIPLIYLAIFIIIITIVNALLIYLVGLVNVALLIAIFPFFIIMILFQITKPLFDSWMKYFISNAVVALFLFATISLMVALIFNVLGELLSFEICKKDIISYYLKSDLNFSLYFWVPVDDDFNSAITLSNLGNLLIIAMLFNRVIGEVPSVAETISSVVPSSQGAEALKGALGQAAGVAQALNPIGIGLSAGGALGSKVIDKNIKSENTKMVLRTSAAAVHNAWTGVQKANTMMNRIGSITEGMFGDQDYSRLKKEVNEQKKEDPKIKWWNS